MTIKRHGYVELGYGRLYETMVFKAKKFKDKCCPWRIASGENIDFDGYNDADSAAEGHRRMVKKYAALRSVGAIK